MIYLANSTGRRLDEEELWPLPSDKTGVPLSRQAASNDAFFDALDREITRLENSGPITSPAFTPEA